jgi:hypothetical protein
VSVSHSADDDACEVPECVDSSRCKPVAGIVPVLLIRLDALRSAGVTVTVDVSGSLKPCDGWREDRIAVFVCTPEEDICI